MTRGLLWRRKEEYLYVPENTKPRVWSFGQGVFSSLGRSRITRNFLIPSELCYSFVGPCEGLLPPWTKKDADLWMRNRGMRPPHLASPDSQDESFKSGYRLEEDWNPGKG
ncbi:hypothetical protein WG66_007944, partial [Moniliophthora roreri]